MDVNNKLKLEVGDWVKGITRNGALIHGYLENFKPENSRVLVKIVVSDNEQIIGNTIRLDKKDINKLDDSLKFTEKQLENLIDLALLTKDQSWFMELTSELKNHRQNDKSQKKEMNII